jgi:predicted peroxiredoxin
MRKIFISEPQKPIDLQTSIEVRNMTEKLGILITTDKYKKDAIGIARAAKKSGRDVTVFLMDDGVFLLNESDLADLLNEGIEIHCCDHSRERKGVDKKIDITYGSQYQNAVMMHESDKVLVF